MGESKELQDPCQERGPTCSWEADSSKDKLCFSQVGETDVYTRAPSYFTNSGTPNSSGTSMSEPQGSSSGTLTHTPVTRDLATMQIPLRGLGRGQGICISAELQGGTCSVA